MNSTAAPSSRSRLGDPEQPLHLDRRERRGGLVHDQDLGLARQRLGDLDELLLGDRQSSSDPIGIHLHAEAFEDPVHLGFHGPVVNPSSTTQGLTADEHVLGHGQVRKQRGLLIDHGDPRRTRIRGSPQHDLTPVHEQRAGVRLMDAAEDLH